MDADVYADDHALRDGARSSRPGGAATFDIVADADPHLVARIGGVLNLLNVAPCAFHMECRPGGMATVQARVDCAEFQAELVARKLQQLTMVREVVVSYGPAIHAA
jgi:hypothetical protein